MKLIHEIMGKVSISINDVYMSVIFKQKHKYKRKV